MSLKTRPIFICFSGIDGCGKTTQSKLLLNHLNNGSDKFKYVWNRFDPLILKHPLEIGKRLFFRKKTMFEDYPAYIKTKKEMFKNPLLSWIYQTLYLFEYILFTIYTVKIPVSRRKSIICDRYVYDLIAGFSIDTGIPHKRTVKIINFLLSYLPSPDIIFLIDVPEKKAIKRKDDIPSVEFLKERRDLLLSLKDRFNMQVIDGEKSIEEIHEIVKESIGTGGTS